MKLITSIVVASSILLFSAVVFPVSADNSRDWRFEAHSRSIDIDICVRCTSTIPGPQGMQNTFKQEGELFLMYSIIK